MREREKRKENKRIKRIQNKSECSFLDRREKTNRRITKRKKIKIRKKREKKISE